MKWFRKISFGVFFVFFVIFLLSWLLQWDFGISHWAPIWLQHIFAYGICLWFLALVILSFKWSK